MDRDSLLMYIFFGACCYFYNHIEHLPHFLESLVAFLCEFIICCVVYLLLVYHALGYLFAGPYQPPAEPERCFSDHFQVYLNRWWRMSKFLGRQYAGLCAQYLLRLTRAKARNEIRKYMGYRSIWEEEDCLWLRDLNTILFQQLEVFNETEMLPLDRSKELYLDFESVRFDDFSWFLDRDVARAERIHEATHPGRNPRSNPVCEHDHVEEPRSIYEPVASGINPTVEAEEVIESKGCAQEQNSDTAKNGETTP